MDISENSLQNYVGIGKSGKFYILKKLEKVVSCGTFILRNTVAGNARRKHAVVIETQSALCFNRSTLH